MNLVIIRSIKRNLFRTTGNLRMLKQAQKWCFGQECLERENNFFSNVSRKLCLNVSSKEKIWNHQQKETFIIPELPCHLWQLLGTSFSAGNSMNIYWQFISNIFKHLPENKIYYWMSTTKWSSVSERRKTVNNNTYF